MTYLSYSFDEDPFENSSGMYESAKNKRPPHEHRTIMAVKTKTEMLVFLMIFAAATILPQEERMPY
jgi:hypothetical protein